MKKALTVLLVFLLLGVSAFCFAAEEKTLTFSTTDLNGNTVDESILEGHKVILFNVWEPWCRYCVKEMPALERLYQAYKDKGLLIVGLVNRSPAGNLRPEDTVRDTGVTYPILNYCAAFDGYCPQYSFPASFFTDGQGKLIDADDLFTDICIPAAREEAAAYASGAYDVYLDDPRYAGYQPLFDLLKAASQGGEEEIRALAAYYAPSGTGSAAFYGMQSEETWAYLIGSLCGA